MKYLKISNKGLLDIRLVSLMGGTTKSGNDYMIGRFGSGLKYSLAWLVRNNVDFKIFIGEKEVKIKTKREVIRDTDFDIIYINGKQSSITSTMGADFTGWMVCREIYSNAIDEGGLEKEITETITGHKGRTTFYLQVTDEIKETVENWERYFLVGIKPIFETKEFAIYPPTDKMRIYKNGILIEEAKESKSVFSYDFKNARINEMREYKGILASDISNAVAMFPKNIIEIFLSNIRGKEDDDVYESRMDYEWYVTEFNDEWKETIGQGKIISEKDYTNLKERGVEFDEAEMVILPDNLANKLNKRFKGISAVRRADMVASFYETYDKDAEFAVKKALTILEACNYEIAPDLKFVYGTFGDASTFAKINIDEKVVMFSKELKNKPLFDVVTTIMEENAHYITGFPDMSRKFQQFWIDQYALTMLKLNKIEL